MLMSVCIAFLIALVRDQTTKQVEFQYGSVEQRNELYRDRGTHNNNTNSIEPME